MKKFRGLVVSSKMKNTAAVLVERWVVHPLYGKRYLRHKKYHTDNSIDSKAGDRVEIVETRPISKTKRWKITRKLI